VNKIFPITAWAPIAGGITKTDTPKDQPPEPLVFVIGEVIFTQLVIILTF
jgi:hypothetical protein